MVFEDLKKALTNSMSKKTKKYAKLTEFSRKIDKKIKFIYGYRLKKIQDMV